MSKGVMHTQDNLVAESQIACLNSSPRFFLQLVQYTTNGERHFLLRRMKWFGPDNVKGVEIKFGENEALILLEALERYVPKQMRKPLESGSLLTKNKADGG